MNNEKEIAVLMLKIEEGFRHEPYYDTEEYPSIGYGEKIGGKFDPLPSKTISEKDAAKKLESFVEKIIKNMKSNPDLYRAYSPCNAQQKAVLISMAYQLGIYGLLLFRKLIAALHQGDFEEASKEILNSLQARQTPKRWARNAEQMRTGILNDYYLQRD